MRFLIDTHILIWYLEGDVKLPDKIKQELNNDQNIVVISVVSLWELAIKLSVKKILLSKTLSEIQAYIIERDFVLLNISFDQLTVLSTLPLHHKDPFDRLLIAQAITENLTLISVDQHFQTYLVDLLQ